MVKKASQLYMKTTKWFGVVAMLIVSALPSMAQTPEAAAAGAPEQAQPAAPASLSPTAAEVVKLAGSGVGEDVVLAYIQNSQLMFNLSADAVLYLRDVGISQPIITAMLNHDNSLRPQEPQSPPSQYAPTATAPALAEVPAPAPAPVPAPAPQAPPPQVVVAAPTYVSSPPPDVGYFYNDLAPYGTWVSLAGVGWCWQPSVVAVNRGWRPYCDSGHWIYTDAGWYWQSDYSWGWAPFHYGRWYMDASCGWVWQPGRTWGPAWVTWRTVGTTCGWAPLPPGADFAVGMGWRYNGISVGASFGFGLGVNAFAFVSFNNFCANNVSRHCMPPAQANVFYKQTTIVNNYTVVNNTFVNRGIPVERIGAASRIPVPRASLHEGRPGQPAPAGLKGPVVYRTPLGKADPSPRMVAQKVDNAHPQIRHAAYQPAPSGRGNTPGVGRPGSGLPTTPNANLKGERTPVTGSHGGSQALKPNQPASATGRQNSPIGGNPSLTPGGGSGKSQTGGGGSRQSQNAAKPAYERQSLPTPKSYPGSESQTGAKASSGSQSPTTSRSYTPGLPAGNKTLSSPQNSSTLSTYPGGQPRTGTKSFSGTQPLSTTPSYSPGASSRGQSAVPQQRYQSSTYPGGGAGQGQLPAAKSAVQKASPQFYTPKTVDQSSQVRSLSDQPKTGAAPGGGSSYGTRRNR
jgi:hypothetical protein